MHEEFEHYPLIIKQQIAWGEMDAFAHVNNTIYFRYFETARMSYFDHVGIMDYVKQKNIGPILASTSCNFLAPLTYPDEIQIAVSINQVWEKRFNMHTIVYSKRLDKIAAQGDGMIVFFDYNLAKSCPIPAKITAAINCYEAN